MARKSFVQLAQELLTSFPDNINGAITPQVLRDYFTGFLDAIRPAYGLLQRAAGTATQALTLTYAPLLVWDTAIASDVPDFTVNSANGTIVRVERGTIRITLNGGVSGANGNIVTIALYRNGVATSWASSATCTGAAEPVMFSLDGLFYSEVPATYQLQVKGSAAATYTFQLVDWVCETVPVNTY